MDPKKFLSSVQKLADTLPDPRQVRITERAKVKQSKRQSFVSGTIFGVLAGAVAGILLAPKSGEKTRRELANQGKQLKNRALGSTPKSSSASQPVGKTKPARRTKPVGKTKPAAKRPPRRKAS